LVISTALTWQRRHGPVGQRAFFTLAAAAAIFFAGLMVRWDLHALLF
jgi:hypothetical protein